MPPKPKSKISNQQDKRHDAGLAPPVRRVSKDRSNTSAPVVVGHASIADPAPASGSISTLPPGSSKANHTTQYRLPTTGLNKGLTFPRPASQSPASGLPNSVVTPTRHDTHEPPREHLGINASIAPINTSSSAPGMVCSTSPLASAPSSLHHLTIRANRSIQLASGILSSFPLPDALALLIILLSLPPTLLFAIQGLFAAMCVSPASLSGLSQSFFAWVGSVWSLASPGGAASPVTIVFIDVVFALIYLAIPSFAQNAVMDMVHSIIALSLSGSSDASSMDSCLFCIAVGMFLHFYRYDAIYWTVLHNISWLAACFGLDIDAYAFLSPFRQRFDPVTAPTHGWPRVLLGCHIIAQGIFSVANRSLAGASRPQHESKANSDAVTPVDEIRSNGMGPRYIVTTIPKLYNETTTPLTLRDRPANSRERRKYANQVRSQQPLWAAVASTKIAFLKQLEQKQASEDAIETGALSEPSKYLSITTQDRVEVRAVTTTTVELTIDIFTIGSKPISSDQAADVNPISGHTANLFTIRVNGADWASTRIVRTTDEHKNDISRTVWELEVQGLTPLTKYRCDISRSNDSQVIGSLNLITLPVPQIEVSTASTPNISTSTQAVKSSPNPAPTQQPALRPLSPISTLRQSLARAEAEREDFRNRLKRNRREQKQVTMSMRRDIDQLHSKVASASGSDDKNKARISQLEHSVKQAEDAVEVLLEQQASLETEAANESQEYAARREAWEAIRKAKLTAMNETSNLRSRLEREMAAFTSDLTALENKRAKLVQRRDKMDEQVEQNKLQQTRDMQARQRHENERAALLAERADARERAMHWIKETETQVEQFNAQANTYYQEIDSLQGQMQRLQQSQAGPISPEGILPSVSGIRPFDYDMPKPLVLDHDGMPNGHMQHLTRGRSSTMLSGYSGFTDELKGTGEGFDQHSLGQNGSSR